MGAYDNFRRALKSGAFGRIYPTGKARRAKPLDESLPTNMGSMLDSGSRRSDEFVADTVVMVEHECAGCGMKIIIPVETGFDKADIRAEVAREILNAQRSDDHQRFPGFLELLASADITERDWDQYKLGAKHERDRIIYLLRDKADHLQLMGTDESTSYATVLRAMIGHIKQF